MHEAQLAGGFHGHISKDFDDVVEHRIGTRLDAGSFEVGLARTCGERVSRQVGQRSSTADDAAQHSGAAVMQRQVVSTVYGGQHGQIDASQDSGSRQIHHLVVSLCSCSGDAAAIHRHAATCIRRHTRQGSTTTHNATKCRDAGSVHRQALRTINGAAKCDVTRTSADQGRINAQNNCSVV